jgi:hypothetical protein
LSCRVVRRNVDAPRKSLILGEALDRSRDVVTGENKSAKNTREERTYTLATYSTTN